MTDDPVLSLRDVRVRFTTDDGEVKAVDGVSYDVSANEVLGVVGESGSGKTVTALAILGLLPRSATVTGEILFQGQDLLKLAPKRMQKLRGDDVAMVFQDALAALNPVFKVGEQIAEAVRTHRPHLARREAWDRAVELLDTVGIPHARSRADQYPHEFSGGMRQRAMIAMAIVNEPLVLIADEPTTALDVTIQAQVLEVFGRIQERTRAAIILITHDLGIVAGVADRVVVMYAGRAVEEGTADDIFYSPHHPYTIGLLASLPRLDEASRQRERLYRIRGQCPSLLHPPPGCAFHPRCDHARLPGRCNEEVPMLRPVAPSHVAACHYAEDIPDQVDIGALGAWQEEVRKVEREDLEA